MSDQGFQHDQVLRDPDVLENHVIARRISTMDTAATALDVLGLQLAATATGKPVAEAFEPSSAAGRLAASLAR